jgi:hypothetical protein
MILPNIVLAVCTIHELWNPLVLNQFSENINENTIILENIIYKSHTLFEISGIICNYIFFHSLFIYY